jgi:hypothetical protein
MQLTTEGVVTTPPIPLQCRQRNKLLQGLQPLR